MWTTTLNEMLVPKKQNTLSMIFRFRLIFLHAENTPRWNVERRGNGWMNNTAVADEYVCR
jgi:hypothetical protein